MFCIKLARFFYSLLLTICIGGLVYYVNTVTWSEKITYDTFTYPSCKYQDITRLVKTKQTWDQVLLNEKHREIIIHYANQTFYYYQSAMYLTITEDIFRALTFNLIKRNTLEIDFIQSPCTFEDIKNIFISIGRPGIYLDNTKEINIPISHIILFILNGILGCMLTIYVIYFGGKFLYKEWKDITQDIRNSMSVDNYQYFKRLYYEIYGPYNFIYHFLIQGEEVKEKKIYLFITFFTIFNFIPYIGIFIFQLFNTNQWIKYIVIGYSGIYFTIIQIYSSIRLFGIFREKRKWITIFYYYTLLSALILSTMYFINTFLWFLLSITTEPILTGTVILISASICIYIKVMVTQIIHFRKELRESSKFKGLMGGSTKEEIVFKKHTLYKTYGITIKDMVKFIFFGLFITILVIIWIVLSWFVMSNNNITLINFFTSLVIPLSTFYTKIRQLRNIKKRMHKFSSRKQLKELRHLAPSSHRRVISVDV